jgi:2-iminobutanoate/2-iminopropanoate deaminase
MTASAIATSAAPAAIGPYSQGVAVGGLVFTSGQLGIDPATGEFAGTTASDQARRALLNVGAVLAAAGLGPSDVAKVTVFLADIADFAAVNAVYAEFFTGPVLPARSAVQVAALPKGGLVEIEAVALKRQPSSSL